MSHGPNQSVADVRQSSSRAMASATLVNRTHRVIRERAGLLQAQRKTIRSLVIPLAVSAGLLIAVLFAVWTVLDEYDISPTGAPDASQQIFVLIMWCLPVLLAVLAVVLFRRNRTESEGTR